MKQHSLRPGLAAGLLLLAACQGGPRPAPGDALARCEALFATQDHAVEAARVGRSHPHRVAGFPYLRVTRLLSSYRDAAQDPLRAEAWLARLADEDERARDTELGLLPPAERDRLAAGWPAGLAAATAACRDRLLARDRGSPERLALLAERAVVADEYSTGARILGLYPLAAIGLRAGVLRWHDAVRARWQLPRDALAGGLPLERYAPAAAGEAVAGVVPRDALGLPVPSAARLSALLDRHAPVWVVATASAADRPGVPRHTRDGPTVIAGAPTVYRYPTITRFRGSPRLQLNYLAWFGARPAEGALDPLAGALDGVIWRVTLDEAGAPLAYDSVHACGCYHLLFPVGDLRPSPDLGSLPEPPLVLPALEPPGPGERMHLFLAAGSHYLERAWPAPPAGGQRYRVLDREALYRVAGPGGERSLFDPGGLVPGTARGERWFLWPSGVRSPGAMRERGRRATAFLGRRHFDDPFLLETVFGAGEAQGAGPVSR
ncbi:hypothetical protein [Pseudohaliea sp.]|uniref:hypothetical protein n=1 Tax=Pseudohaliea sp. TaxID=2740289 RepID=UPI0032EC42D7